MCSSVGISTPEQVTATVFSLLTTEILETKCVILQSSDVW
jgi:hypothetical protein